MQNTKLTRRIAAIVFLLTVTSAAQTSGGNWNTVKALVAATEVRVTTAAGSARGSLDSTSDEGLTLRTSSGQQMFARQDLRSVSVRTHGHRLRNTLIGFGAGTGVGLGIGYANDCRSGFLCGLGTAVGGVIGALGGTVIGVVWPTGGWREVYHA